MQQEVGQFPSGFSNFTYEHDVWRVFALTVPEDGISVEVMEQQAERRHLIGGIESGLLWPFMRSLPLAALMFLRALEWGLGGLRRVTRQINTRSPELMLPLAQDHIPTDLLPLVEAVNRLLGKLSAVLDRERQLTDHAAHELRTPLSVPKLQAQMARRASNEQDRSEALDALLEGADRANHVIDQLLTLARVKNQDYPVEDTDVMQVAHESVGMLAPLLAEKDMQVAFEGDGNVMARANHHLFAILFGNIINNAIKYAPAGSQIRVRGMKANGVASVSVSDEGPGIPENERDRVFERFYRMEGSVSSGSGLGLTIAGQCAAQMGAAIRLETSVNGTGLCVRVEMPGT
jgi:two-component system sensor histidine kinase QseC